MHLDNCCPCRSNSELAWHSGRHFATVAAIELLASTSIAACKNVSLPSAAALPAGAPEEDESEWMKQRENLRVGPDHPLVRRLMAAHGGMSGLLELLASADEATAHRAAWALYNACDCEDPARHAVVCGSLPAVAAALQREFHDVQLHAVSLVAHLAGFGDGAIRSSIARSAVLPQLVALLRHECEGITSGAAACLSFLTKADEDGDSDDAAPARIAAAVQAGAIEPLAALLVPDHSASHFVLEALYDIVHKDRTCLSTVIAANAIPGAASLLTHCEQDPSEVCTVHQALMFLDIVALDSEAFKLWVAADRADMVRRLVPFTRHDDIATVFMSLITLSTMFKRGGDILGMRAFVDAGFVDTLVTLLSTYLAPPALHHDCPDCREDHWHHVCCAETIVHQYYLTLFHGFDASGWVDRGVFVEAAVGRGCIAPLVALTRVRNRKIPPSAAKTLYVLATAGGPAVRDQIIAQGGKAALGRVAAILAKVAAAEAAGSAGAGASGTAAGAAGTSASGVGAGKATAGSSVAPGATKPGASGAGAAAAGRASSGASGSGAGPCTAAGSSAATTAAKPAAKARGGAGAAPETASAAAKAPPVATTSLLRWKQKRWQQGCSLGDLSRRTLCISSCRQRCGAWGRRWQQRLRRRSGCATSLRPSGRHGRQQRHRSLA